MVLHPLNTSFLSSKSSLRSFDKSRFQPKVASNTTASEPDISPHKIVSSQVVKTLEKVLNTEGLSLKELDVDSYTPQKTADNIMLSIKLAMEHYRNSNPGLDESKFFSQVKEGLSQGFGEAKDILQNLGVLQGEIADDFAATYNLTIKGLDRLQSDGLAVDSSLEFQHLEAQSSRSSEIQIETQEGDLVTINFNESMSINQSAFQKEQTGTNLSVFQEEFSENSEFTISVEGNLNKEETKSLNRLMKKMYKVGNAFFNGNAKKAIKQAQRMGFDSQQIAGFTMDLSLRKSVQAVSAYQQTLDPEAKIPPYLLAQAADFMNHAKEMLADTQSVLEAMAMPKQSFKDLFSEIGDLINAGPKAEEDKRLFDNITDSIGENLFTENNN